MNWNWGKGETMNADELSKSFREAERIYHKDGTISIRASFEMWAEIYNLLAENDAAKQQLESIYAILDGDVKVDWTGVKLTPQQAQP
jgi:hypothetical protein